MAMQQVSSSRPKARDNNYWADDISPTVIIGSALISMIPGAVRTLISAPCRFVTKTLPGFVITPVLIAAHFLPKRHGLTTVIKNSFRYLLSARCCIPMVALAARSVRYIAGLAPVSHNALQQEIKQLSDRINQQVQSHYEELNNLEQVRDLADAKRCELRKTIDQRHNQALSDLLEQVEELQCSCQQTSINENRQLRLMQQDLGVESAARPSAQEQLVNRLSQQIEDAGNNFQQAAEEFDRRSHEQEQELLAKQRSASQLEQQLTELQKKLKSYECNQRLLADSQQELRTTRNKLLENQQTVTQLQAEYRDIEEKLNRNNDYTRQLFSDNEQLINDKQQLLTKNQQQESELQRLFDENIRLQQQLERKSWEHTSAVDSYQRLSAEYNELYKLHALYIQKVKEHQVELDSAHKELQKVQTSLALVQKSTTTQQNDYEKLLFANSQQQTLLKDLREQNTRLQDQLEETSAQLQELQHEHQTATKTQTQEMASLAGHLTDTSREASHLERLLKGASTRNTNLLNKVNKLESELKDATHIKQQLEEELRRKNTNEHNNSAMFAALQEELSQSRKKVALLESQVDELGQFNLAAASLANSQQLEQQELLKKQMQQLQEENGALRQQAQKANTRAEAAERDTTEMILKKDRLQRELDHVKRKQDDNSQRLTEQFMAMKQDSNNKSAEVLKLSTEIEERSAEVQQLSTRLKEKEQENAELQQQQQEATSLYEKMCQQVRKIISGFDSDKELTWKDVIDFCKEIIRQKGKKPEIRQKMARELDKLLPENEENSN